MKIPPSARHTRALIARAPCQTNSPQTSDPLPGWKRTIDLVCCGLAFPVFALLTLGVTLMVRLTSPGPVFFRQERVGLMGRRFRIYKFRTMHAGADTTGHKKHLAQLIRTNAPMQKLDTRGDSRLLPGGWLLRATGLDELPQILQVWQGDMSIVGPRPCIVYEFEQYTAQQRERLKSLPGLTGLWQVSGKNRTTFAEMIQLDREYAARQSLWLDLKIIALTVPTLGRQVIDGWSSRRRAVAGARSRPLAPVLPDPSAAEMT